MINKEDLVKKQTKAIVTLIKTYGEEQFIDLQEYFAPHHKQISDAIKEHFSKVKELK